jgi:hypothetical protein
MSDVLSKARRRSAQVDQIRKMLGDAAAENFAQMFAALELAESKLDAYLLRRSSVKQFLKDAPVTNGGFDIVQKSREKFAELMKGYH